MNRALPVLLGLSLFFPACAPPPEPAPLKDGLFLEYQWGMQGPMGGQVIPVRIDFRRIDTMTYEGVLDMKVEAKGSPAFRVDLFFEYAGDKRPFTEELLGPLWLQPALRKEGARAFKGKVRGRVPWEGMEVLQLVVVEDGAQRFYYFDPASGFLAGSELKSFGSRMFSKLVATNCDPRPAFLQGP